MKYNTLSITGDGGSAVVVDVHNVSFSVCNNKKPPKFDPSEMTYRILGKKAKLYNLKVVFCLF
jgi:hypothetical protein